MVATVPISTAHRVAESYEERSWGKAYRDVSQSGRCVRVSSRTVSCPFTLHAEAVTSTGQRTALVDLSYDVFVKRHGKSYIVWES